MFLERPWHTRTSTHRDALLFLCRSELLFNCKKDDEDDSVIQAYKAYDSSEHFALHVKYLE